MKNLKRHNVNTHQFVTFKNWNIQNIYNSNILLTEDNCPLFTSYVPESYVVDNCCTCSYDLCFQTSSLCIEYQEYADQSYIRDGENKSGIFYEYSDKYYNSKDNPVNRDGTYKRVIYSTAKQLFYNDYENPLQLFGIENYQDNKEKRILHEKIRLFNITNNVYGEKIQPTTVRIKDFSDFDQPVYITDDGFTNLKVTNKIFDNNQLISPNHIYDEPIFYDSEHDRFGYVVSSWNNYILIGCPMDFESNNRSKNGTVHLYKWDDDTKKYRFLKKFDSLYSRNGISQELGHDSTNTLLTEFNNVLLINDSYSANNAFGKSICIDDEIVVIGAHRNDLYGRNNGVGHVFCYSKEKGGDDHWGLTSILEGSSSLDEFGFSVELDGDKLAVGAPGAWNNRGQVYIFKKVKYGIDIPINNNWIKIISDEFEWTNLVSEITIVPPSSLIMNEGKTAFIYDSESDQTTLYFFDQTSSACNTSSSLYVSGSLLTSEQEIPLPHVDMGDDDNPYITLYMEEENLNYISGNITYTLESIIRVDSKEGERFGGSLSLSGSYLLVGNDNKNGSVYLFESKSNYGWTRSCKYDRHSFQNANECSICSYEQQNNNLNFYDTPIIQTEISTSFFGKSIKIHNDLILIGCPVDSIITPYSGSSEEIIIGSTYVYKLSNNPVTYSFYDGCNLVTGSLETCGCGKLVTKLYESDNNRMKNNTFGYSVDMNDTHIVVGSIHGKLFVTSSFYNDRLNIEDYYVYSETAPVNDDNSNGKFFVYEILDSGSKIEFVKSFTKHKPYKSVKNSFGNSICLTEKNEVVVGSPMFLYGDDDIKYIVSESSIFAFMTEITSQSIVSENTSDGEYSFFSYDWHKQINYVNPNLSGSVYVFNINDLYKEHQLGNVFYKNGIISVTNTSSIFENTFGGSGNRGFSVEFKGQHTLYEKEIICSVEPGEFNYSTNPTSLKYQRPLYDINNNGVVDCYDIYLISKYIRTKNKLNNIKTPTSSFYNSIILQHDGFPSSDKSWWNNDILLTESEDVLWPDSPDLLVTPVQTISDSFLFDCSCEMTAEYLQYLDMLYNKSYLDVNDDGIVDILDSSLIHNYFSKIVDYQLINGNITINSKRRTVDEIIQYLNTMFGVYLQPTVNEYMLNYIESSSCDRTGSYLSPYVTTIGLYDNGNLIAVAKLSEPIKILQNYPINFVVKLDF